MQLKQEKKQLETQTNELKLDQDKLAQANAGLQQQAMALEEQNEQLATQADELKARQEMLLRKLPPLEQPI